MFKLDLGEGPWNYQKHHAHHLYSWLIAPRQLPLPASATVPTQVPHSSDSSPFHTILLTDVCGLCSVWNDFLPLFCSKLLFISQSPIQIPPALGSQLRPGVGLSSLLQGLSLSELLAVCASLLRSSLTIAGADNRNPWVSISNISPGTWNTEGSWDPLQLRAEWWLPEDERVCFPQFYNRGLESSSGLV